MKNGGGGGMWLISVERGSLSGWRVVISVERGSIY